jgi:signal transduction histidine kinase/HAMP domain-containing protein
VAASVTLAALSLLVAIIASSLVRRRLAPLGRLTERAQSIAAGDRSPIPEELRAGQRSWFGGALRDEVTDLAEAFAAMVRGVATRDADLLRLRRRQEDIVDHLRAAVVALAADGRVEAANPAARTMLGARIGAPLADSTPTLWSILAPDLATALADAATEPQPHLGLAVAKQAGDVGDAARVVDVRVVPMRRDVDAAPDGRLALLVVDDVTDAAVARTRALQAERLAAIGKMAAHVTHEIRNPLSSIGLNVELLEESLPNGDGAAEARRLLAAIAREVQRLSDVSEDYLRLARAPQTRPAPIDLCELVRDVASFARPELERAGVRSTVVVDAAPIVASADEGQIRQSLLNLIRNAREALEDGGELTVSVARDAAFAVVRVADDGPGIAEEARARVFDPFFTTKSTGTGLGLPLTRQIVEAHGGTIACEPVVPKGTCFVLRLPLLDAALPVAARAASNGGSADDSSDERRDPSTQLP